MPKAGCFWSPRRNGTTSHRFCDLRSWLHKLVHVWRSFTIWTTMIQLNPHGFPVKPSILTWPCATGRVGSFSHWPKPPAEAPQPPCQRCTVRLVAATTAPGCGGSEKKGPLCDVQVEGTGKHGVCNPMYFAIPHSWYILGIVTYVGVSSTWLIPKWGEDGMESLGGITAPCIQYISWLELSWETGCSFCIGRTTPSGCGLSRP